MHNSNVRFELLTFYIKTRRNRLVYVSTKIRTNKILKVALMYRVLTNITWRSWASELTNEPDAAHPNVLSCRVSVRVRNARYESYMYIPNLKVVVGFNVTAQTVHKIYVVVV